MRQRPAQIFAKTRADLAGEGARLLQPAVEVVRAVRQAEGLQLRRAARRVLAHQHEVARIGHQNQSVAVPVAADLIARRGEPRIASKGGADSGGLHFHHAVLRRLPLAGPAPLDLLRPVETEVGMARALIGQLPDTEHLGLEGRADGVEQVRERCVARPFPGPAARGAYPSQIDEVRLDRRPQLPVRSCHRPCCRRARPSAGPLGRRCSS